LTQAWYTSTSGIIFSALRNFDEPEILGFAMIRKYLAIKC